MHLPRLQMVAVFVEVFRKQWWWLVALCEAHHFLLLVVLVDVVCETGKVAFFQLPVGDHGVLDVAQLAVLQALADDDDQERRLSHVNVDA